MTTFNPNRNLSEKIAYDTGLYLRLSAEEVESGEKLKNQEDLLKEYINGKSELHLTKIYCDNGYSGTSFNRPGWLNLMEDIRKGIIRCIVVKDFSRLGRNYIETGNYLEMIFPFMGVRFISVNDFYDSVNPSNDFEPLLVSLKNLSNDAYAKDISKKIFTAKEIQRQKGLYYGNVAPYGYWKDDNNPHHLVINKETAPNVMQIFLWKLEGFTNSEIANRLNEENILAPMKYLYELGKVTSKRFSNNVWQGITVKVILSNRTYTGDLTQGKKRKNLSENQRKIKKLPAHEWVVVENTHEPIVSRDLFFQVQQICEQERQINTDYYNRHSQHINPENIFCDLVYCKATDLKMYRTRTYYKNRGMRYRFTTISKQDKNGNPCPIVSIREEYLIDCIKAALEKQAALFLDLNLYLSFRKKKQKKVNQSVISDSFWQIKKVKLLLSNLYQDYADGLLTLEQYLGQKKKYREQLDRLEAMVQTSSKQTAFETEHSDKFKQVSSALSLFDENGLLTRELVLLLVKRIYVYSSKELEVIFQFQDELEPLIKLMQSEVNLCRQ